MDQVQTIHGLMNVADLEKREGAIDNEHETTTWVEYWWQGELVHRSVHVHLKQWPGCLGELMDLS